MGRKESTVKRTINDYITLLTPNKYNSNQHLTTPPGFHNEDAIQPSYHDQCLTHGLSVAVNALLGAITLTKANVHKWAILDSGATSNFMMTNAHVDTKEATTEGINVSLPDGNKVQSTHRCTLNIPGLPKAARKGHIIPGLASHSLISVVILCDKGCEVTFNKASVRVTYNEEVIMTGRKCQRTGLWMVPLDPLQILP